MRIFRSILYQQRRRRLIKQIEEGLLQASRDVDWETIYWALAHRAFLLYDRIGSEMVDLEREPSLLMALLMRCTVFLMRANQSLRDMPYLGYVYRRSIASLKRRLG